MPQRHEVTNFHKALNVYNIFLVKSLCPIVKNKLSEEIRFAIF